ncbi:hypothetical protein B0A52_03016 [Exophiala mesophila]|uniref:SnoaL-like domain-containing protein n=1 Tax=Exophiala mesophila TaxID=212818 RepID=A0A438NCP5_EXOME|nr:hypothetical protein B0A52_03016 [Exophiala mesophila]
MVADTWVAESEIKSLLIRERYYRDTQSWDALRSCYHPDASITNIRISWFSGDVDGFVQGSKAMAKSGTLASHTIQPVEVHIKGSKAVSVSTGSVQIRLILDDIEYDMTSWVIFLSRLSLVSSSRTAQWRLLSLEAVYDRDSIAATKPIVNTSRAIELSPNARPSYKYLEWL